MNLYLVHCGFYDEGMCDGLYESHVNFMVAASDFDDARRRAKEIPEFRAKFMHVDGLLEISSVAGFRVHLLFDEQLKGKTIVTSHKHRDLAPKARP